MFKILGVNDDKDFCECCGKSGLKSVVWIENLETGLVQHFGSVCATNPSKAFGITKKDIARKIKEIELDEIARLKNIEKEKAYKIHRQNVELRLKTDAAYESQGGTFNKLSGLPHSSDKWNKIKEEFELKVA